MTSSIVGLDIGSESVRAVEVQNAATANPVVVRYRELALPADSVVSGQVAELNTVATVLRQLWSIGGFRSKKVVLGVGSSRVLVRDLAVPHAGARQVRDALPYQVQDLLTVPVADAILDFYPNSAVEEDSGPMLGGLLIAAGKESINANVNAARMAGLVPVEVDLIPFALVRLQAATIRDGAAALIDVGARTTTIVVTLGGIPFFVRIIPTGGGDLTRILAERLDLLPEQAEHLKRTVGLVAGVSAADDAAAEAIHLYSRDLLDGIRNTLRYVANSRPDVQIRVVCVSGGGADLVGFRDALAEITRVPVVVTDPFAGVGIARRFSRGPHDRPSAMGVALGLALGCAA